MYGYKMMCSRKLKGNGTLAVAKTTKWFGLSLVGETVYISCSLFSVHSLLKSICYHICSSLMQYRDNFKLWNEEIFTEISDYCILVCMQNCFDSQLVTILIMKIWTAYHYSFAYRVFCMLTPDVYSLVKVYSSFMLVPHVWDDIVGSSHLGE